MHFSKEFQGRVLAPYARGRQHNRECKLTPLKHEYLTPTTPPCSNRGRSMCCQLYGGRCAAASFIEFPQASGNLSIRSGRQPRGQRPAHRLDEFPAGYSSAGCTPAWPASASPARHQYAVMSSCRSRIFHRTANCVLTVCLSPGGHRSEGSNGSEVRCARSLHRAGQAC